MYSATANELLIMNVRDLLEVPPCTVLRTAVTANELLII
jgi:hypothetical protein